MTQIESVTIAFTPSLPSLSNSSLIDLCPVALANCRRPCHPSVVTVTWWTFLGSGKTDFFLFNCKLANEFGCFPRLSVMVACLVLSPIIPHIMEYSVFSWVKWKQSLISKDCRHKKTYGVNRRQSINSNNPS